MYQVSDTSVLVAGSRALLRRRSVAGVGRTVVLLGLTSLFTDVSSEMVAAILPLYLVYSLGVSPLQFGVVDGVQQGASSLVRVAAGFAADRLRRYRDVAALGYGLSAAARIGFLLAGRSWALLGAIVFVDRTGKGIRTAPRDALISLNAAPERLGIAFGVHRALDTAGAIAGPLVAFGLLASVPQGYSSIFVVSFCFALVGLAILVLFVRNEPQPPAGEWTAERREAVEPLSLRAVTALLAVPRFRALVVASAALALATLSDGFVYLGLQRNLGFGLQSLPLLYAATSIVYMLLAVPVGRLSDRVGRGRVFVLGYLVLLVVYAALVVPSLGSAASLGVVVAFGAYYAATDGVLAALASSLLPVEARASGLALVATATNLARLAASVTFGAAWVLVGVDAAVGIFAAALVVAAAFAALLLGRFGRTGAYA